jgi:pyruvate carboxylase
MVQNDLDEHSLVERAETLSFPASVVEFMQVGEGLGERCGCVCVCVGGGGGGVRREGLVERCGCCGGVCLGGGGWLQ